MATLHLICGLPCAGKTTLARQIEQQHSALRLTPDEWHIRLFGMDYGDEPHPEHDARHEAVERLMWEIAARVLALGVDVVLDFGVWAPEEREWFRSEAAKVGAGSELHFLNVPEEILLARLAARNAALPPGTFAISEASLREWMGLFQPPTPDELQPRP